MSAEHFNKLTPAQAERLAILMEEMGEAQQVIGKILRHGYTSSHPDGPNYWSNRLLLAKELGHVQFAVEQLCLAEDIHGYEILRAKELKATSIGAMGLRYTTEKYMRECLPERE